VGVEPGAEEDGPLGRGVDSDGPLGHGRPVGGEGQGYPSRRGVGVPQIHPEGHRLARRDGAVQERRLLHLHLAPIAAARLAATTPVAIVRRRRRRGRHRFDDVDLATVAHGEDDPVAPFGRPLAADHAVERVRVGVEPVRRDGRPVLPVGDAVRGDPHRAFVVADDDLDLGGIARERPVGDAHVHVERRAGRARSVHGRPVPLDDDGEHLEYLAGVDRREVRSRRERVRRERRTAGSGHRVDRLDAEILVVEVDAVLRVLGCRDVHADRVAGVHPADRPDGVVLAVDGEVTGGDLDLVRRGHRILGRLRCRYDRARGSGKQEDDPEDDGRAHLRAVLDHLIKRFCPTVYFTSNATKNPFIHDIKS